MNCIFCDMKAFIGENSHAYAIYDKYPVTKGHVLIIPKRHVRDYFELSDDEELSIWGLLKEMKLHVEAEFSPSGWNIGINNGEAAGQTIFHLHVHLIPRYDGDMDDPAGGIRGVIPERMKY